MCFGDWCCLQIVSDVDLAAALSSNCAATEKKREKEKEKEDDA